MSYDNVIGVDMSKDKFDYLRRCSQRQKNISNGVIKNAKKEIQSFIRRECQPGKTHVVMEATGNYHLLLETMLHENNIDYSVVNPLIIKRFADMKMKRCKTDKADAKTITEYGCEQKPKLSTPPSPEQQALRSMTATLDGFVKQQTQLKNMLHAQKLVPSENKASIKAIKALLKSVGAQIKKLEAEQQKLIKETDPETYELTKSVVGIGVKTATAFSAYYGDLSQFEDHKQIVASVGINPKPQESGTSLNISSGISKKGNKRLRTHLYMAALTASRHNKACAKLYKRLIKKGKHKKTALIAVANKLIKQVFAVVKSKTMFDNNYCPKCIEND